MSSIQDEIRNIQKMNISPEEKKKRISDGIEISKSE